jgi:hypothetical protein
MRNLKFRKRQSVCASAAVPPLRATAHASAGSSRSRRRRRSERPPLHGRQWSGEPRAQSSSYSVTRLDQSKREKKKKEIPTPASWSLSRGIHLQQRRNWCGRIVCRRPIAAMAAVGPWICGREAAATERPPPRNPDARKGRKSRELHAW